VDNNGKITRGKKKKLRDEARDLNEKMKSQKPTQPQNCSTECQSADWQTAHVFHGRPSRKANLRTSKHASIRVALTLNTTCLLQWMLHLTTTKQNVAASGVGHDGWFVPEPA
jgi:hypothetical protein